MGRRIAFDLVDFTLALLIVGLLALSLVPALTR